MTPLSILLSFFPTVNLILVGVSFFYTCHAPGIASILSLLFSLYGLPVLAYRVHHLFYPIQEGIAYLRAKGYSPWWGSHQIQAIYIAIPTLEAILRLIPGAFSLWLRLWGAKVGKQVYWTPHIEIADRSLLEIGDRVVFGHRVGIYPHVIKPKKDDLILYVKRIKIGNDVFVGAGSNLTAGVSIADGTFLPAITNVHPNQKV